MFGLRLPLPTLLAAFTGVFRGPLPTPPTSVPGYFSAEGLPPVFGDLQLTRCGLLFRSSDGALLVRRRRLVEGCSKGDIKWWRVRFSLAYLIEANGQTSYLFRLDNGIFETSAPGELLRLADQPLWLDAPDFSLRSNVHHPPIVEAGFTDTLYALFGRPRALGPVGADGRRRVDLAEYVAGSDSVALDLERISSQAQLRHALAHELAHRWATRFPARLDSLWKGVPAIQDPQRYGYRHAWEQGAEAVAFAVHFLQTTASGKEREENPLTLLDHYEILVPGTRVLTSYLVLQPVYRAHPLRAVLAAQLAYQPSPCAATLTGDCRRPPPALRPAGSR
jgi:hypothetical protein